MTQRKAGMCIIVSISLAAVLIAILAPVGRRIPWLERVSKRAKRNDPGYIKMVEYEKMKTKRRIFDLQSLEPWYLCKLTKLLPSIPVVTPWGALFDLQSIVSRIKENGTCPVTEKPITLQDLTKITIERETTGRRVCPVTKKKLDHLAKVICIRTSGRIYSYEAIQFLVEFGGRNSDEDSEIDYELWRDPVSGEPFRKDDIIVIQDPFDKETEENLQRKQIKEDERAMSEWAGPKFNPSELLS
ncbi:hypothetical protein AAMO2058_000183200 [Amorphochlora amoebiformis]